MKKAITLRDIARETGVHVSTVSRALDARTQASLTAEVVERVRATAERMGYRPNRLASGLRTNRTMTVGLVIPDITNAVFPLIVRGIESVLEPLGYASIIVNTDNLSEREHRLVDLLQERGVDGVIHAAATRNDPKIVEMAARGIPMVTVNRSIEHSDIPAVVSDDARGVQMMLQYLYDQGHRRIAHLSGPAQSSTGQARRQAFVEAAQALGLELPQAAIVESARYEEDEGRRAALRLLDSGWPFTAILCANDRLALGAIAVLRARGLDCPADVSVTGFNDMPLLDLILPRLTTIRIQQFEVGKASAEILVRIMTETTPRIPRETVLPVFLVERDSVAPPRAASRRAC
ncbi:LacI family DNA-binding transcriptional regulator [Alkalilacustris brevis]|uniref:LacI family DNA-binding transcriptional regulator n=1 Tax=Alkalilacustris brevis TaxID=2026338 RepID=UPI000E0D298A|nr:LacI family DNA-binding transcriptional regulator [Alkalilacustris brevis]